MELKIKERFMEAWNKYFSGSELPIACFYTNELNNVEFPAAPEPNAKGFTCIFSQIAPTHQRRNTPLKICDNILSSDVMTCLSVLSIQV